MHYYKSLARAFDQEHRTLDLVMVHAETSRIFEYAEADDRDGMASYLVGYIDRLRVAGAELVVIPAVTPHFCIRELVAISPLRLLNLFDPMVKELSARSIRRIAVFGTRFVIESALFGMAGEVEVLQPQPDEIEYIHRTYVELAQKGEGSKAQYSGLTDLALTLCKRDGADAIVLAGTDLTLLFNETNIRFPYLDCARMHLEAIVQELFPGENLSQA